MNGQQVRDHRWTDDLLRRCEAIDHLSSIVHWTATGENSSPLAPGGLLRREGDSVGLTRNSGSGLRGSLLNGAEQMIANLDKHDDSTTGVCYLMLNTGDCCLL